MSLKTSIKILHYVKKIVSSFLPLNCALCGMASHYAGICHACQSQLPWLREACQRCGYLLSVDIQTCGECLKKFPPYDNTVALFRYEAPIDYLILAIKFNKNLAYAKILGEFMGEKIREYYKNDQWPDIILPVPLHINRLKERGFNQAVEIIRPVAKALNIPLSLHECVRAIHTEPQMNISMEDRVENVKQAFTLKKAILSKHVAIFDDVVTTGSTVSELARLLKRHGVERVDVWCCARTL